MELSEAKESFAAAAKCAETRRSQEKPDLLGREDPASLVALCDQVQKTSGDRFRNAALLLGGGGSPEDQVAADVINYFADNRLVTRSAFGASPMDRHPGQCEIAVDLIASNGGAGQVKLSPGGKELTISGIAELTDLSSIRKLSPPPIRVRIEGASALDWTSLAALPLLESLDLTGCQLSAIPPTAPSFQHLKNLVLKNTAFTELWCVRSRMPQLVSLDISDTQISDLAPLATCSWLLSLDAGKLSLTNLQALRFLPLSRLTISPTMVSDKAALNALRTWRLLRVVRAPNDPADQPATEFWKKLDAGGYDTGKQ